MNMRADCPSLVSYISYSQLTSRAGHASSLQVESSSSVNTLDSVPHASSVQHIHRGGASMDLDARPSHEEEDESDGGQGKEVLSQSPNGESSQVVVAFNMCNGILGSGVLGFPYCFKNCGILLATLCIFLVVVASDVSLGYLLDAAQLCSRHTYEGVAEYMLGRVGYRIVYACVVVLQIGSLVGFLNILADTCSSVAGTIIPPGMEPSRTTLMAAVTLAVFLPLALFVKSEKSIAQASSLSMSFIFIFMIVVVYEAAITPPNKASDEHLVWWDSTRVLVSFPVICFGYTAHAVLLPIVRALHNPTRPRVRATVRGALALCTLTYFTVGLFGYLAFRDSTAGDILRNFSGTGAQGMILYAVKSGYATSVACTVPMVLMPLRDALVPLLDPALTSATSLSPLRFKLLSVAILLVALLIAMAVPNIEFVFGLTGASTCVLLAFIMPSIICLSSRHTGPARGPLLLSKKPKMFGECPQWCNWLPGRERFSAYVLIVMGLVAATGGMSATLGAVQEEGEVVSLVQDMLEVEEKTQALQMSMEAVRNTAASLSAFQGAVDNLGKAQDDANLVLQRVQSVVQSVGSLEQISGKSVARVGGGSQTARFRSMQRNTHKPLVLTEASLAEARAQVNKSLQAVMAASTLMDGVSQARHPQLVAESPHNQSTLEDSRDNRTGTSASNDASATASPPEQETRQGADGAQEISISKIPREGMQIQRGAEEEEASRLENKSLSADIWGVLEPEQNKAAKHVSNEKPDHFPGTNNHHSAHNYAHSSDKPRALPSLDHDLVGDSLRSHANDPMQVSLNVAPLAASRSSHTHGAAHHRDRASKKGPEQFGESLPPESIQGVPQTVTEGLADITTTMSMSLSHVLKSRLITNMSISKVEDGKGHEKGVSWEKSEGKGDPLAHTKGHADDEHSLWHGEVGESGHKTLHPSNASSAEEVKDAEATSGDENELEMKNVAEETPTRETQSKPRVEDNDGSADFMQSEDIEEMQHSINQTMTALMETAAVLDDLEEIAEEMKTERKAKQYSAQIAQLSSQVSSIVNSSVLANLALNQSLTTAKSVIHRQEANVKSALQEAAVGLASIGQEEKKFEQQEAKEDPIDRVYPRGDTHRKPNHPDPQHAIDLNTTDAYNDILPTTEPPTASHVPPPSLDAADPLFQFESLIQPGMHQGGENETVPANQSAGNNTQAHGAVDEERAKEADMRAERSNRTMAVLQSIATFQYANESSESPPVNASDFAKAAAALVEAWNEESAAFFQAKVAAANPRVAARAEKIARSLGKGDSYEEAIPPPPSQMAPLSPMDELEDEDESIIEVELVPTVQAIDAGNRINSTL